MRCRIWSAQQHNKVLSNFIQWCNYYHGLNILIGNLGMKTLLTIQCNRYFSVQKSNNYHNKISPQDPETRWNLLRVKAHATNQLLTEQRIWPVSRLKTVSLFFFMSMHHGSIRIKKKSMKNDLIAIKIVCEEKSFLWWKNFIAKNVIKNIVLLQTGWS